MIRRSGLLLAAFLSTCSSLLLAWRSGPLSAHGARHERRTCALTALSIADVYSTRSCQVRRRYTTYTCIDSVVRERVDIVPLSIDSAVCLYSMPKTPRLHCFGYTIPTYSICSCPGGVCRALRMDLTYTLYCGYSYCIIYCFVLSSD